MPLLVGIVAALSLLGAVAGSVARGSRQAVGFAGAGLGGLGFLVTLLSLLLGQGAVSLDLPIGLPGYPLRLTLDPLATFFLLPIFLSGTAGIAVVAESGDRAARPSLAGLIWCLAGTTLTILADDGATMAIGLCLAGGAVWVSGEPTGDSARPRALQLGVTVLAALCVLTAKALPDLPAGGYVLALVGPAALAGLAPFHLWSIPAHRAAPARAAALLSGAMQPLAVYLLVRLLLDLPASLPLWWGVPLLVAGAATMLTGGWRAACGTELEICLAALAERQSGLAATGIGLASIGRAADLPAMTILAEEAVLLLVFAHAVCGTLAQLTAGAMRDGAGSRRLSSLGGLIHSMPSVASAMAAVLYGLSGLPAGVGFAALWLLFQALLAAPRSPFFALVAVALALSVALTGAAAVRLFGVAFLGRPRTPRTAGATDIAPAARPALLVLAGLALLLGLFPGVAILMSGGAIRQLTSVGLGGRAGVLGLEGLPVLPQVLLGLAIAGGLVVLLRRRGGESPRLGPGWNDGFASSPPWLPFGEPLTQWAGAGLLPVLPRWPGRWRTRRIAAVPVLLGAMAVFLAALLWLGAG